MVKLRHSGETPDTPPMMPKGGQVLNSGLLHPSVVLGGGKKCDSLPLEKILSAVTRSRHIKKMVFRHLLSLSITSLVYWSVCDWANWRDWAVYLAICAVYATLVITGWRVYTILAALKRLDDSLSQQNKNLN